MNKNTLPRHYRPDSKEFQTAISIIMYLKSGRILLPTPVDLEEKKLCDIIGLGMKTVTDADIPEIDKPVNFDDIEDLIDA